ncbi:MAG: NAD(P)-dependent alcohol dehydrogenase [Acidobacteriaceae bacterium]|nr:NAD(P)-dependent alcohol dehydrogenase [Acidobacteriaceae bacterium]MBV9308962.1 NAD(P)-dependent alcohol dehydrogenase [Acidobacteriaceae bacterium]
MNEINALAAKQPRGKLEPFSYDPGPLGDEQVEIEVQYCGMCHSDYSMWANEWGMTTYPFVPGHEAIGKVVAVGVDAKFVKVGQTVGLGWNSGSCLHCRQCLHGAHNMCNHLEQTIVGRYGAFGTRVRCHWVWATPIPEGVDPAKAGPLLCGGITVFSPLVEFDVRPTDRVGVLGIGGLGHIALQFLNKWGCHVTAFTTSANKAEEAKKMGAHEVLNTRSEGELKKVQESFNFILSTVAASDLDLNLYLSALAPKGRLHIVGFVPEVKAPLSSLLFEQRSISSSPSGPPITVMTMLDFCARHKVEPITEEFPMTKASEAFEHLEAGKARYRIVLQNDLH